MISAYVLQHLREKAEERCPRCKGRSFIYYDEDNPRACEPCGCDEADDEDEAS